MIYTLLVKDENLNTRLIISFDTVRSFSENLSATSTDNVVEYGFPISDHILVNNINFDLDVVVSSFTMFDENLEMFWDGADFITTGEAEQDKHLRVRRELKALILNRQMFSLIITEENAHQNVISQKEAQLRKSVVDEYVNCICTSLTLVDSEATTGAIFAKLNIKQIKVAFAETRQLTGDESIRQITPVKAEATVTSATQSAKQETDGTDSSGKIDPTKDINEARKAASAAKPKPSKDDILNNRERLILKRDILIEIATQKQLEAKIATGNFSE